MKKISAFLISLLASSALYAAEPADIKSIREYYSETLKRIKSGSLYKREISITNPFTPGASATKSRLIIYYEVLEGRDGQYAYTTIRVENYFQYAATVFYEEYLFSGTGGLRFYYGRRGLGDASRADAIKWEYDERYYFRNSALTRVMYGNDSSDKPFDSAQGRLSAEDVKKGGARLTQAQQIREQDCTVSISAPVLAKME